MPPLPIRLFALAVLLAGAADEGAAQTIAPHADALNTLPLPRPHARSVQFASTDPSGGNVDHGHFLSGPDQDGWYLLAAWRGAGIVDRFWSANPRGELSIEIDSEPFWHGRMVDYFGGPQSRTGSPLGDGRGSGGGVVSYDRIAFTRSLRVRVRGEDLEALYYQLGLSVANVGPEEAPDGAPDRREHWLSTRPVAFDLGEGDPNESCRQGARPHLRATMNGVEVFRLRGSGQVAELRCTPVGLQGWTPELRRGVWLECYVDDSTAPQLAGPLGDVFGVGFDGQGVETLPVRSAGRSRLFRLPMPYHHDLRVVLRATGVGQPPAVDIAWSYVRWPEDQDRGVLHGRFRRAVNHSGQPFEIARVSAARGHLIGAFFTFAGAAAQGLTYLEGDEYILVDGDPSQAIRGTGTEDDIGGAWYFRGGPFGAPFHAVAYLDDRRGLTTAARFRVLDPVSFTRSLHWTTEHGGANDAPGSDYGAMAFWYQFEGPPPPVMDARARRAAGRRQLSAHPLSWHPEEVLAVDRQLAPGTHRLALPDTLAVRQLRGGRFELLVERQGAAPLRSLVDAPSGELELLVHEQSLVTAVRANPWLPAIRSWRLAGPFPPRSARRGLDELFGPEHDHDPATTYPRAGGDEPLRWKSPPSAPGWTGYLDLNAAFTPNDEVVAYACTRVRSPIDQDVTLVLGSDDAVKVFVDGREIHRKQLLRGAARDQDRIELHLSAGDHQLLIKVEDYLGGFGLYARFEGASGLTFSSEL